jgi:hypothetical protein
MVKDLMPARFPNLVLIPLESDVVLGMELCMLASSKKIEVIQPVILLVFIFVMDFESFGNWTIYSDPHISMQIFLRMLRAGVIPASLSKRVLNSIPNDKRKSFFLSQRPAATSKNFKYGLPRYAVHFPYLIQTEAILIQFVKFLCFLIISKSCHGIALSKYGDCYRMTNNCQPLHMEIK